MSNIKADFSFACAEFDVTMVYKFKEEETRRTSANFFLPTSIKMLFIKERRSLGQRLPKVAKLHILTKLYCHY